MPNKQPWILEMRTVMFLSCKKMTAHLFNWLMSNAMAFIYCKIPDREHFPRCCVFVFQKNVRTYVQLADV